MKTVLWTTAIVLTIVAISLGMNMYLTRTAWELSWQLEQVQQSVRSGRWAEAEHSFEQAAEQWKETRHIWALVIRHQEIDALEVAFARISQFLSVQELAESLAELEAARSLLEHIPEKERVRLQNIM